MGNYIRSRFLSGPYNFLYISRVEEVGLIKYNSIIIDVVGNM